MRYLVFSAKHHDGFCTWPTDTTDHSIRSSPYRGGKGDLVEQVAEACREAGLLFGVYCSPWDRHDPRYPDPAAYDQVFLQQWRELLTRYGPVFCCWLDGAGSAGRVYGWERIIGQIRELQPEACVFNMGEPDYRWVGNEEGLAPDPCWNALAHAEEDQGGLFYTSAFAQSFPRWLPAEAPARLRQNWFWNTYDAPTLKSVARLADMYEKTVGHGCNLLLNCGPDTRGRLPEADVARLEELGAELKKRWGNPVSGDEEGTEIRFGEPTAICREDLMEGEHVREYALQIMSHNDRWESVCLGSALGHKKMDHFPTVVAQAARVVVSRQDGPARVRSFGVYHQ